MGIVNNDKNYLHIIQEVRNKMGIKRILKLLNESINETLEYEKYCNERKGCLRVLKSCVATKDDKEEAIKRLNKLADI